MHFDWLNLVYYRKAGGSVTQAACVESRSQDFDPRRRIKTETLVKSVSKCETMSILRQRPKKNET